jgi:hypothetical protein
MAARLNPQHDARTRLKIKTSQLINRLQAFALADFGDASNHMSNGQVRAALGLLAKTVPDLQSVALTDPDGGQLTVRIVRFGSDAPQ